ncbi:MAG TPA: hypothetical protein VHD91_12455 [Gaiellaceae bacterium]|nr:hypothetical protein [Gaiellaceae bacterium]
MSRALVVVLLLVGALAAPAVAAKPAPNPLGLKIVAGKTSAGPFAATLRVKSGATMDLHVTAASPLPAGDVLAVEWQEGSGPWHHFATCAAAPCDELARQSMATTTQFRAVVKAGAYSLAAKALSTARSASVTWTR